MVEILNECLFIFLNYYMITFSELNLTIERHYDMGFAYIYTIGVIVLVNVMFITLKIIKRIKNNRRLDRIRTLKNELMNKALSLTRNSHTHRKAVRHS